MLTIIESSKCLIATHTLHIYGIGKMNSQQFRIDLQACGAHHQMHFIWASVCVFVFLGPTIVISNSLFHFDQSKCDKRTEKKNPPKSGQHKKIGRQKVMQTIRNMAQAHIYI